MKIGEREIQLIINEQKAFDEEIIIFEIEDENWEKITWKEKNKCKKGWWMTSKK